MNATNCRLQSTAGPEIGTTQFLFSIHLQPMYAIICVLLSATDHSWPKIRSVWIVFHVHLQVVADLRVGTA